jgi:hypothetical protein
LLCYTRRKIGEEFLRVPSHGVASYASNIATIFAKSSIIVWSTKIAHLLLLDRRTTSQ